jgi:HD-GYP domain-containing protein (c-di-GMP phosphodiesterase class II)
MTPPISFETLSTEAGTSLTEQMEWLHEQVRHRYPAVHRIAITLYDSKHGVLKTYVNSSDVSDPLSRYERPLESVPSLAELARNRASRVINDLSQLPLPHVDHTHWLLSHGYASSFTVPLFQSGTLLGFMFFDSREMDAFGGTLPDDLQIYVQLCRMSVLNVINLSHAVEGMVKVARGLAHLRDIETGQHLDRMSSYSRLIARSIAAEEGCDDEFIEHVYLFAPLHDIGKIGIADSILLKPGRLTDEERTTMQGHVNLGVELVDAVMNDTEMVGTLYVSVLRNIVHCHHEWMDGSGYPRGLVGEAIPLEARIVTIADIFDALTSERPYKKPWSNEDAMAELHRMAEAGKLDRHCVAILDGAADEVRAIQQKFGITA